MADLTGVKVGDVLWYQPFDTRDRGHEIRIEKIGRKFIYSNFHSKFEVDTGLQVHKGYSSSGRVYLTKADHDAEVALTAAYRKLADQFWRTWTPPAGVTIDNIKQARALLGLGDKNND